MRFLEESKNNLPRMITIQNHYSLLNRQFEVGNAEVSIRENIGLLAYSPLGCGVLSGKYIQKKIKKIADSTYLKDLLDIAVNKVQKHQKVFRDCSKTICPSLKWLLHLSTNNHL